MLLWIEVGSYVMLIFPNKHVYVAFLILLGLRKEQSVCYVDFSK